ncbi:MAG: hypothetical protein ACFFAS_09400 [Promethearchaeota archaeon]
MSNLNLEAQIMAECLAYSLDRGRHYRRACHYILRKVINAGAEGVEIRISWNFSSQGAIALRFKLDKRNRNDQEVQEYFNRGITKCTNEPVIIDVIIESLPQNNENSKYQQAQQSEDYDIKEEFVPVSEEEKKLLDEV